MFQLLLLELVKVFLLTLDDTGQESLRVPAALHEVKELALLQLWHRLQLQLRFDPWPRNFHMPRVWPKDLKNVSKSPVRP